MTSSSTLCTLHTDAFRTDVQFDFGAELSELAGRGDADGVILSTEDGFSPLGRSLEFLRNDLQLSDFDTVRELARWNRFDNKAVSLIACKSKNPTGLLRGVVLAAGENCRSYENFASRSSAQESTPNREYYYSVTYESISYLCKTLGATAIAIAHLSGSGRFHPTMAVCHLEALFNFCHEYPQLSPRSFTFFGCCISQEQLSEAKFFLAAGATKKHRPIGTSQQALAAAMVITLDL
jgi:hypothetical protein